MRHGIASLACPARSPIQGLSPQPSQPLRRQGTKRDQGGSCSGGWSCLPICNWRSTTKMSQCVLLTAFCCVTRRSRETDIQVQDRTGKDSLCLILSCLTGAVSHPLTPQTHPWAAGKVSYLFASSSCSSDKASDRNVTG